MIPKNTFVNLFQLLKNKFLMRQFIDNSFTTLNLSTQEREKLLTIMEQNEIKMKQELDIIVSKCNTIDDFKECFTNFLSDYLKKSTDIV